MLVVKHRHALSCGAEGVCDLKEQFVTRIKMLAFLVVGIVAMLADDQHAVDVQLVGAAAQRLGDGGINLELLKPRGPLALLEERGDRVRNATFLHARLEARHLRRSVDAHEERVRADERVVLVDHQVLEPLAEDAEDHLGPQIGSFLCVLRVLCGETAIIVDR